MRKTIIIIACLIFGPYLAWRGGADLSTGWSSKSWPTVLGTIRSSQIKESRGRRSGTTYIPVIKYDYEVSGAFHSGDRVDGGSRDVWSLEDAMEIARRYPEGEEVQVHYDPANPRMAFLEVGVKGGNWLALAAGLLMTGGGLISVISLWRRFRSDEFMKPANGF